MKWITFFVFGLVLLYVPLWSQTNLLLESIGKDKPPFEIIKNPQLQELIKHKTGTNIETIKIVESDRPFGMMMGFPGFPQLLLSRALYNTFTSDELEYVLLHEAGHYNLAHSIKELLLGLTFCILGIYLLKQITNTKLSLSFAPMLGLIFGIVLIQFGKINEVEADRYSVSRLSNPNGMVTATENFREYYDGSFTRTDNKVLQWMFYRANPYENRIQMAQEENAKR